MVATAVRVMEATGETGFSVRKVGAEMGCDPMAILYHFKSKEGLHRAMADWLTAQLRPVPAALPWDARLRALAMQYRQLALQYRGTFGLMLRFVNTGVSDFAHIEAVYGAICDAGVPEAEVPAVVLSWYAAVYGLAAGETGGMIRPATQAEQDEVAALPDADYPLLKRFMPRFASLDSGAVFEAALGMLHAGIRVRAGQ
ncbi:Transcriptional regulator, TetR family [plant metagenome]|uniref:Transcriptional regulator, TetR family n=3 Tax=root TaxID=1 RepID=A0A1C3K0H7_9BURK|nr:Transcriptional regulator, TetR family [Orrella dioscoreae]SOE50701.1 Transcriptional regulator, TetR family [Orrella dioscoreae]